MNEKKIFDISKITSEIMNKGEIEKPQDYVDQFSQEYDKEIFARIEKAKIEFPFNDFYIEVSTQKVPLFENAFRYYYIARLSCPTPNYDQTLYFYDRKKDELKFIWVIPDCGTCHMLVQNHTVVEERELLKYVLDFEDGTLARLCMKLNGETPETPQVILFNKE